MSGGPWPRLCADSADRRNCRSASCRPSSVVHRTRRRWQERAFEFAVERAVFIAALHRLFVSGSDRDCASWIEDYDIPGAEGLELHHFYRAMAWLGEELEETPGGAIRTAAPSRLFSTICT
jgi:hypothetical protein